MIYRCWKEEAVVFHYLFHQIIYYFKLEKGLPMNSIFARFYLLLETMNRYDEERTWDAFTDFVKTYEHVVIITCYKLEFTCGVQSKYILFSRIIISGPIIII
jgi:hypothetical protein